MKSTLIFPLSKSGGLWFYFFHACLDNFNTWKYMIIMIFFPDIKMYVVSMHTCTEVHLCTIQLLGSFTTRCRVFMSSDHSPGVNMRGYLSSYFTDWDTYVLATIGMKYLSFFQGNYRKTTASARCFQIKG